VDILEVPVDTAKDAFAQFMLTRESRSVSITVLDLIQHVRHSLLCHDQFSTSARAAAREEEWI
jgi:hypothetical protein